MVINSAQRRPPGRVMDITGLVNGLQTQTVGSAPREPWTVDCWLSSTVVSMDTVVQQWCGPLVFFFKDAGTADVIARQLVQLGLSSFALQDPWLGRPREQPGEDAHACCCAVALLWYTAPYTLSGHA